MDAKELSADVNKLEAENDRLRAALESIASCNPLVRSAAWVAGHIVEIAREALERDEATQNVAALNDRLTVAEAVREACIIEACEFVRSVEEAGELRHHIESIDLAEIVKGNP